MKKYFVFLPLIASCNGSGNFTLNVNGSTENKDNQKAKEPAIKGDFLRKLCVKKLIEPYDVRNLGRVATVCDLMCSFEKKKLPFYKNGLFNKELFQKAKKEIWRKGNGIYDKDNPNKELYSQYSQSIPAKWGSKIFNEAGMQILRNLILKQDEFFIVGNNMNSSSKKYGIANLI